MATEHSFPYSSSCSDSLSLSSLGIAVQDYQITELTRLTCLSWSVAKNPGFWSWS